MYVFFIVFVIWVPDDSPALSDGYLGRVFFLIGVEWLVFQIDTHVSMRTDELGVTVYDRLDFIPSLLMNVYCL